MQNMYSMLSETIVKVGETSCSLLLDITDETSVTFDVHQA